MTRFFRRVLGALALDPATYEEIEADKTASWQAMLTVALTCVAAGVALMAWTSLGVRAVIAGAVVGVGAWLVWLLMVTTIGTRLAAEPRTDSDSGELLRTLGFASAPGMLITFAAIKPAALPVVVVTSIWMIAAATMAVRQALDYRSAARAALVCAGAWLLSFGIIAALGMMFSQNVQ